jgi:hypothetical protein
VSANGNMPVDITDIRDGVEAVDRIDQVRRGHPD